MNCFMANDNTIVFFYVDDIIFLFKASNKPKVYTTLAELQSRYQLRILPKGNWFLGIRIIRNRSTRQIWLCQDSYIDKITAKLHQNDSVKTVRTPMTLEKLVPNDGKATAQDIYLYQQQVGSINFATTMTRPDTAFTISKLS